MPFDVVGAKKAGYSDDEIADHLAQQSKFDIAGAKKAGYSSAEIIGHLNVAPPPKIEPKADEPGILQSIKDKLSWQGRELSPDEQKAAMDRIEAIKSGKERMTVPEELKGMGFPGAMAAVPGSLLQPGAKAITMGAGLIDTLAKETPVINKAMKTAVEKAGTPAELSQKFKVPISYGEETANPFWQKTESLLEKVPVVGTGNFRVKQAEATKSAAQNFLGKYIVNPESADFMAENRAYSSSLYDGLKTAIGDVKASKMVYPSETNKTAKELLGQFPATLKQLGDAKSEAMIKSIVKEGKTGIPFNDLWELRKNLGGLIGQARKQINAGNMNETQHARLKELFGSVSSDMETWAVNADSPKVTRLFNEANGAYKQYVVKYDIVQRAYDKAAGAVGGGEMFSPKTFSTEMKKLIDKDKAYRLFTPAEKEEMAGLANIMQVAKRGGMFMENPPTGARWGGLTAGAIGGGGAVVAGAPAIATMAAGAATTKLLTFLTTTGTGKGILRNAAKLQPDSAGMKNLMKEASKYSIGTANIIGQSYEGVE